MTADEMVDDMLQRGYEFALVNCRLQCIKGPSEKYSAYFYVEGNVAACYKCDQPKPSWRECGHGDTIADAIAQARDIALSPSRLATGEVE